MQARIKALKDNVNSIIAQAVKQTMNDNKDLILSNLDIVSQDMSQGILIKAVRDAKIANSDQEMSDLKVAKDICEAFSTEIDFYNIQGHSSPDIARQVIQLLLKNKLKQQSETMFL